MFATCRDPAGAPELAQLSRRHGALRVLQLDVENEDSIARAASRVREHTDTLGMLINVAGVLHGAHAAPEKRLADVSPAGLEEAFRINAFGPLLVAKHFESLLTGAGGSVFASLSARVGSIADNRLGGWYAYRASKAAQNMFIVNLSIELRRKDPELVVLALHPGTVDTQLSKPFTRRLGPDRLFDTVRGARQLLDIVDRATPEQSGRFYAWDGSEIPW